MSKGIFYYTEAFRDYNMGANHPLKPIRLERTRELLHCYDALREVEVREPPLATREDLETTHRKDFIEAVAYLSENRLYPDSYRRYGFGAQGDNPVFEGMYEASLIYTGASVAAAQAVNDGETRIAINISGGLHHAHGSRAAGFCIFNDCAIGIHRLRRKFARVAYVDIDVHHGDGVQEAFYDDPTVLTISIHESGRTLFPGTGFVKETGEGEGVGSSVNVPLAPYTDDALWLETWRATALPLLKAFDPEAIFLQMGCDPHYLDPLAHVCLTAQGWLEAVKDVKALGKPLVAVGGGGYNPTTVPRLWTLACAELYGVALDDNVPASYSYYSHIPTLFDHESPALDPEDRKRAQAFAEQTVEEVRRTLFPYHGLI